MHINNSEPIAKGTRPLFDTVLVDINCVAHLAYRQFEGDCYDSVEVNKYIEDLLAVYFRFPFLNAKSYIVFGDFPPYWRSRTLSRNYGTVYKGTRAERSDGKKKFLQTFAKLAGAITKGHYEADDLIAEYVRTHPEEKICILTIDSDLIQLAKDNVTWFCCKGFFPQVRSESNGNLEVWLSKKFHKLSKKKIGHLDPSKASSIVEWKVIYGDSSDNIPAGEGSRILIDLNYPVQDLSLSRNHPEFIQDCEDHRKTVIPFEKPLKAIDAYEKESMYFFITKLPTDEDWGGFV